MLHSPPVTFTAPRPPAVYAGTANTAPIHWVWSVTFQDIEEGFTYGEIIGGRNNSEVDAAIAQICSKEGAELIDITPASDHQAAEYSRRLNYRADADDLFYEF